ncbi:MAG: PEP-CTERM sorting domain-containing protein [Gammaproteobacteria bacterium]|nr:PEP-CTERM sorting domain-containing protein [Gammaproteobacteria bacterium]
MKTTKLKGLIALFAIFFLGNANATLLDFNDSGNLGVELSGRMTWNGTGGGHLYDESYDRTSSVLFATDTFVNSFELNNKPWEGYYTSTGTTDYIIQAFNLDGNLIWNTLVDLTSYSTWDNWLTLTVNVGSVRELKFGPAGPAMWPSIDNMVINNQVPEPAAFALMGLGLAGIGWKRRKAA